MKYYIDETYDHKKKRTYLFVIRLTDEQKINIYRSVKKKIIAKTPNKKFRQKYLTEFKGSVLRRDDKVWPEISLILNNVGYVDVFPIRCLPGNKEFITQYADIINIIKSDNKAIIADRINNNDFMKKIQSEVKSSSFMFADSMIEKGIQICDLTIAKVKVENQKPIGYNGFRRIFFIK